MEAIKADGLIAASVNPDAFDQFVYLLSGATIDWVNSRISVAQWETMVCYGSSEAVEKHLTLTRVGMVVLRSMIGVEIPP